MPRRPEAGATLRGAHAGSDRPSPRHGRLSRRDLRGHPHRPAPGRVDLDQDQPGRRRRVERERRLRGPRHRGRRMGLRVLHRLETGEIDRVVADATRIARASATALRRPVQLDERPPAKGRYETPVREDPFSVPLEEKLGSLLEADEALNRVEGVAFTESSYAAQREWKTFAATDGSFTEQVITHVGSGIEANAVDGDEHQRRSFPMDTGSLAGRRLRVRPRPAPRRPGGADRDRGSPAAVGPAVRPGAAHDRPRPLAALSPGPRELRPPDRARSRLRHRGELRRDELPHDRQARRRLPVWVGPRHDRRRRDGAGRPRHLRLGRRRRRCAERPAREGRPVRRLPEQPRDRAADRAPVERGDAGRRLEPHPAHPDDEHQPAAAAGNDASPTSSPTRTTGCTS